MILADLFACDPQLPAPSRWTLRTWMRAHKRDGYSPWVPQRKLDTQSDTVDWQCDNG